MQGHWSSFDLQVTDTVTEIRDRKCLREINSQWWDWDNSSKKNRGKGLANTGHNLRNSQVEAVHQKQIKSRNKDDNRKPRPPGMRSHQLLTVIWQECQNPLRQPRRKTFHITTLDKWNQWTKSIAQWKLNLWEHRPRVTILQQNISEISSKKENKQAVPKPNKTTNKEFLDVKPKRPVMLGFLTRGTGSRVGIAGTLNSHTKSCALS